MFKQFPLKTYNALTNEITMQTSLDSVDIYTMVSFHLANILKKKRKKYSYIALCWLSKWKYGACGEQKQLISGKI